MCPGMLVSCLQKLGTVSPRCLGRVLKRLATPRDLARAACTPTLHCALTACAHSRKQAMAEPSVTSSTQPSTPTPWPRAVLWRWWALAPALGLNPTSLTHPAPQADFSRACTVE